VRSGSWHPAATYVITSPNGPSAFLVFAIPVYFNFWNASGEARMAKLNQALLYLSVAGGFLMVAATGAGRYSIQRTG
jgi:uncharacterized membrane protein YphA (DoxX/SURF4 family)